jgi:hypothetical protein
MYLRNFFSLLLILCSHLSFAQDSTGTLIIIGTKHYGNRHFNYQTLTDILQKIAPDVILWEYNKPFKKVFGLKTGHKLGIIRGSIEQLALQKYTRNNKKCIVLPFDTGFNRKQYINARNYNDKKLYDGLESQFAKGAMSRVDSVIYLRYSSASDFVYSKMLDTTLERINSPDVIDSCRSLHQYDRSTRLELVRKYLQDSALFNWIAAENEFWDSRNQFMGRQILHYMTEHRGKKIVILTGLLHKYYLLDTLAPHMNDKQFRYTEFYNYISYPHN